jgi:hypothetical protein
MKALRVIAILGVMVPLLTAGGLAHPQPERSQGVSSPSRFVAPRTPWGDPDLQGTWPSGQMMEVPFERPAELGTRALLTDAEFAKRLAAVQAQAVSDNAESGPGSGSPATAPPPHWLERGRASRQASLIVDPLDGRLPSMTPDGARRAADWQARAADTYAHIGPGDFTPYDRCITRGVLGSAFPNIYSAGTQILQAPGYVIIRHEMIHEARIVPLDGRAHLSKALASYMGDARGHWDGATLVVETTNFNGRTGSYGRNGNGNPTSTALRLVERFALTDPDTLQYRVTVEDPQTWTRPWTVAFPIARDPAYEMYEYACHEGNYALGNILRAARAAERRDAGH